MVHFRCIYYLHKNLNAVLNVVSGSVKVILQNVKQTQLLAVMKLDKSLPKSLVHGGVDECQQGLVAASLKQQLQLAADHER